MNGDGTFFQSGVGGGSSNFAQYLYQQSNANGSTNTAIRKFSNQQTAVDASSLLTVSNSATNGLSVTVNRACTIYISYSDQFAANDNAFGITKNGTELTTSIFSITNHATVLCISEIPSAGFTQNVACGDVASAGDVYRPQVSSAGNGGNPERVVFYVSAKEI